VFLIQSVVTSSHVSILSMYGDIVTCICKHMMIELYFVLIYHKKKSQRLSNTIYVGTYYNMLWRQQCYVYYIYWFTYYLSQTIISVTYLHKYVYHRSHTLLNKTHSCFSSCILCVSVREAVVIYYELISTLTQCDNSTCVYDLYLHPTHNVQCTGGCHKICSNLHYALCVYS